MLSKLFSWLKQDAIRHTFGYYSLFICLGLGMAVTGPTLPALAGQTHTSLGTMGLLFLAGSIGVSIGTLVSGRLFDRLRGHPILGTAQLISAVMIFLVPFVPWFWLLFALLVCKGIMDGFVNAGANVLLSWTHGEKVGPFMNGLHFSFGLGAFLSPLLVAQVIDIQGGYRWAYWALAAFCGLMGLLMLTLRNSPRPVHAAADKQARATGPFPYGPVIAAMFFLFFYVGAELAFGNWIYSYAFSLKLAGAAEAAYLNSGFWLAFTIGRLISIPAATRFKPRQVIPTAVLGCLVLLALAIAFPGSRTILWLVTFGVGFCMAPVWPTGFTLAGQSVDLTGKIAAIILLGDSFGGMVLPSLVGKVIEKAGPGAMIWLVAGSLVLNLIAFAFMLRLHAPKLQPQS
jgi:MFS transporter, FHS family, Na+ dependent glucose transporter 1